MAADSKLSDVLSMLMLYACRFISLAFLVFAVVGSARADTGDLARAVPSLGPVVLAYGCALSVSRPSVTFSWILTLLFIVTWVAAGVFEVLFRQEQFATTRAVIVIINIALACFDLCFFRMRWTPKIGPKG